MADLRRRCKKCSRQFRPQKGATHRLNCYTCAPPKGRAGDVEAAPPAPDIVGPIEAGCLERLRAVERHETVEGLVALSVARDLDAGRVAAAQKPRVGQGLAALMTAALAGPAAPTRTRFDQLAERRASRQAS